MRVLFVVRETAATRSGGDMTQALFTKKALELQGVRVDIAPGLEPDARGYDVAHVFGVFDPEPCAAQMAACARTGVPIALSPIWWDLFDFYARSRACERVLAGRARRIESRLARLRATQTARLLRRNERRKYARRLELQASLMRSADVLFSNSAIEAFLYAHRLHLHDRPMVVVEHAVDIAAASDNQRRSGVVCVARIEPKKNQAMLLYALKDVGVEITLIGSCYEQEYIKVVNRWVTPRVRIVGELAREEVIRALSHAAVHVLPAWGETPGIANLEAARAGVRVVVSSDGTEREYFGEDAEYVDPMNPREIRAAVERALSLPPREHPDRLDRRLEGFTLERVADSTLRGYEIALRAKS
jgi:glycosyltransferase involved in cell wall biosynthesis